MIHIKKTNVLGQAILWECAPPVALWLCRENRVWRPTLSEKLIPGRGAKALGPSSTFSNLPDPGSMIQGILLQDESDANAPPYLYYSQNLIGIVGEYSRHNWGIVSWMDPTEYLPESLRPMYALTLEEVQARLCMTAEELAIILTGAPMKTAEVVRISSWDRLGKFDI